MATAPAGYNNDDYLVGISSGEKIIVIPRDGGRTVNNTNTLIVHSNSKTEDVVGDFGLLEAWAK